MIVDESLMQMREPKPIELNRQVKIDGIIGLTSFDIWTWSDYSRGHAPNSQSPRHRGRNRIATCSGWPAGRTAHQRRPACRFIRLGYRAQQTFVTETAAPTSFRSRPAAHREPESGWSWRGDLSPRAGVPDARLFVRGFPIFSGARRARACLPGSRRLDARWEGISGAPGSCGSM